MNEEEAREKLQEILEQRHKVDILFSETKTVDGEGLVEGNIDWIKNHSENGWDYQVATNRVAELADGMRYQK